MKFFKAKPTLQTIEEVDVDRYSDKSVWIKGDRWARHTNHYGFFPTKQEAVDWMITVFEKDKARYQYWIDGINQKIEKVKAL